MRPIRFFASDKLYFITNRTIQGRFFLVPSKRSNELIGGVLGRALALFPIKLINYTFASNHFHLILGAEAGTLSAFMGYLQSNIARLIGREVGWRGPFWERRFSAEPILDNAALLDRFCYILSHGAKEGLVARPEDWPGLTGIHELLRRKTRKFPWTSWTERAMARLRGSKSAHADATTYYEIRLATLPIWEGLSEQEQIRQMHLLLDNIASHAQVERQSKPPLGAHKVQMQHPHDHPAEIKRSPRPLCHATCSKLKAQYKVVYRCFVEAYQEASALFRRGHADIEFPIYAFRPPMPYGWQMLSSQQQRI